MATLQKIFHFWNGTRNDNFTTAEAGINDAKNAGYQFIRDDCWVFSAQVAGTVPYNTYWNGGTRNDNFTTANPQGQKDAASAGYSLVRTNGYVFPDARPGTVPVRTYWSSTRQDNYTTASPQGWKDAEAAGYQFIRIDCYAVADPAAYAAAQSSSAPAAHHGHSGHGGHGHAKGGADKTQVWTYDGTFIRSGTNPSLCLDVQGAGGQGTTIIAYQHHGGPNQQWRRDGELFVVQHNNNLLDILNVDRSAGAKIGIWPRQHTGPNVSWYFDSYGRLRSRLHGFAVTLNPTAQSGGIYNVSMQPVRLTAEENRQVWNYDGTYIRSAFNPSLCLDVKGAGGQGTTVIAYAQHGGPNQQWSRDGEFFQAKHNSMALDVLNVNRSAGATIGIWPRSHSGPNVSWYFDDSQRLLSRLNSFAVTLNPTPSSDGCYTVTMEPVF